MINGTIYSVFCKRIVIKIATLFYFRKEKRMKEVSLPEIPEKHLEKFAMFLDQAIYNELVSLKERGQERNDFHIFVDSFLKEIIYQNNLEHLWE